MMTMSEWIWGVRLYFLDGIWSRRFLKEMAGGGLGSR